MSVKGIGSPDKYFFEGLEIKPVFLYMRKWF